MNVTVNGDSRDLPDSSSVAALLEELGLSKTACAVEVNATLVTKREHPACELAEGDDVEIVTLVGGG